MEVHLQVNEIKECDRKKKNKKQAHRRISYWDSKKKKKKSKLTDISKKNYISSIGHQQQQAGKLSESRTCLTIMTTS